MNKGDFMFRLAIEGHLLPEGGLTLQTKYDGAIDYSIAFYLVEAVVKLVREAQEKNKTQGSVGRI